MKRIQEKETMNSIKIEKGIPIPELSWAAETLLSMDVGDSILVDDARKYYASAKKVGATVVSRKQNDGVRIWLTKKGRSRRTT